jgi:hypothetical protein
LAVASRWFSARALRLHIALAIVVPACVALCVWQVRRALSGNDLSWAYVFEWPFFAGYGVYMWWRLLHEELAGTSPEPTAPTVDSHEPEPPAEGPEPADEADEELAAYNRYLAQLHASGRQKRW